MVEIIPNNISSDHWFHVPSSQSLADIATHSIPLHTIDHLSWQKRPLFLLQSVEHWPSQDLISLSSEEMHGVKVRPGPRNPRTWDPS